MYFSARKLDNLNTFTTTDSYLLVFLLEPNKNKQQILKTKVYSNDLNPNYSESLIIDFYFEGKSVY